MLMNLRYDVAKVRVMKAIAYILLTFYALTCLGPLIWSLMSALKSNDEILVHPFNIPKALLFQNFSQAWVEGHIAFYFKNTVIYVILATGVLLLIAPMASYVVARVLRSNVLYVYFTLGIMIPIHTILLPSLILMRTFHLVNTRLSLTLLYIAFNLSIAVFILGGFMKSIPKEFEEVAFIDGASRARTFFEIIFPLSRPAIATVGLLTIIGNWNAYLLPLIIITDTRLMVITQGLQNLKGMYAMDYGLTCAGLVITFMPMVVVYILFQEQVIAGLTTGGLKH